MSRILCLAAALLGLLLTGGASLAQMPGATLGSAEAEAEDIALPASLAPWRAEIGKRLRFSLIGSPSGSVWGDGVYTDDSNISTAAVHAGVVQPGQQAVVTIEMLGPQQGFVAAARNGVSSGSYGQWQGSFGFVSTEPQAPVSAAPDPGTLRLFADATGSVLTFEVTGSTSGAVWGDGAYTTDSTLAKAAVHAGVLDVGQRGEVRVEMLGPQTAFTAATRNGVTSGSWGSYGSSFRFVTGTTEVPAAQTGTAMPVTPPRQR